MYDANLVFDERFELNGISNAFLPGIVDLHSLRSVGAGAAGVFLEIETLQKPVGPNAAFQFALLASTTEDVLSGTPHVQATSPAFGAAFHVGAVFPEVETKVLVPINSEWVGYLAKTAQSWEDSVPFSRRYLRVGFINYAFAYSGGAIGALTAGAFRVCLRVGAPNYGRVYPGAF